MVKGCLKGKRVLVAGATGFLGKHICKELVARDAHVFAVARNTDPVLGDKIHGLQADLSEPEQAAGAMKIAAPHVVFHLCGRADAAQDRALVLPTLRSDTLATVNLLMAAVDQSVERFIMTASLEEPEAGEAPSSPYAAAKVASTAYGRLFQRQYKLPVVLVRAFMTYGPGQSESKIVPYLIRCLLKGETPMLGNGDRLIDWIYVEDVIAGLLAAVAANDVEGEIFDLGSGKLVSIRDMAGLAVRLTGAKVEPRFGVAAPRGRERVRVANLYAARERLNWSPTISLEEGLLRTVDFWRKRLRCESAAP